MFWIQKQFEASSFSTGYGLSLTGSLRTQSTEKEENFHHEKKALAVGWHDACARNDRPGRLSAAALRS